MRAPVRPQFFATPGDFRRWLRANHRLETELWVGFHRKGSGRASITWPESVDEALCFGWIDGLRKSIDPESYMIRFTPRKATSNWSSVNLRRAEALIREKRMQPAGLEVFAARDPKKSGMYSFEQRGAAKFSAAEEKQFKRNARAWKFFSEQPPGYKKTATWWLTSAKLEETRARRLEVLIADSAAGLRIGPLRRTK